MTPLKQGSYVAIQRSEAIVLRNRDFRETSLLVSLYTRDFGKISGIVKGLKRPGSRFASLLQPFSFNEIVFYERARGDLYTISQAELKDAFVKIRADLDRTAYASYFLELTDAVSQPHDKNVRLFDLLLGSLRLLEHGADIKKTARLFEVKLLEISGLSPKIDLCAHCSNKISRHATFSSKFGGLLCSSCSAQDRYAKPISHETIAVIEYLQKMGSESNFPGKIDSDKIDSDPNFQEELEEVLRRFLDFHLERKLKTRIFLKKLQAASRVKSKE